MHHCIYFLSLLEAIYSFVRSLWLVMWALLSFGEFTPLSLPGHKASSSPVDASLLSPLLVSSLQNFIINSTFVPGPYWSTVILSLLCPLSGYLQWFLFSVIFFFRLGFLTQFYNENSISPSIHIVTKFES